MTWREYMAGLRPEERDKILNSLLEWQFSLDRDSEIGFSEGEDPSYQGTYTVNAHFYWRASGEDLLNNEL